MKTYFWFISICLTAVLSTGCFSDDDGFFNCERGEGDPVTESFPVDDFDGIELDIAADVYITQGDNFSIEAQGQPNILNELELDVDGDVLDIDFDDCVREYDDLMFWITMPEVDFLSICGSGKIFSENFITTNDLVLEISGSGDMDLGLSADDIELKISGSGKILLEGEANDLEAKVSGSGDVRAFDLISQKVDCHISGSGDMEVHAFDELDVRISGSGDVYYKGSPDIDESISGSGDLINAN